MVVMIHSNDVRITNPKRIELLDKNDVVLLPVWGRSRVMRVPSLLPGSNRTLIVLYVSTEKGIKKLICERNMSFQFEGFAL